MIVFRGHTRANRGLVSERRQNGHADGPNAPTRLRAASLLQGRWRVGICRRREMSR